jgi:hypothetical protein
VAESADKQDKDGEQVNTTNASSVRLGYSLGKDKINRHQSYSVLYLTLFCVNQWEEEK